ncbi:MAG: DUF305 domain-containing protein [Planctomycetales bacterium]|nr:DUF305 domain-containing protein [Planctomycetales bacterium]
MKNLLSFVVALSLGSVIAGHVLAEPEHQKSAGMPQHMSMMNQMIPEYLGRRGPEFDKRFLDMMIPHHEGAIIAAKQVLAESDRPELKEAAQKMIEAQQAEVEQLKRWRAEWYGK